MKKAHTIIDPVTKSVKAEVCFDEMGILNDYITNDM
jgi:hypothetical protein